MNQVIIPLEQLKCSTRSFTKPTEQTISKKTRFSDLSLPARLLLAVPRVRGQKNTAQLAERYVLDTLGRVIDAGPERSQTIEAVNLLAEVLNTPTRFDDDSKQPDQQWLSATENVVLCVLCKVSSGQTEQAKQLVQHWLTNFSSDDFITAANALCDSSCFKRSGPHVFTPSCAGAVPSSTTIKHRSVTQTNQLSLGESLLLNAIRLRMRTLNYTRINTRVLPLMGKSLALPKLEALVDAHLVEALQYSAGSLNIRCLCCSTLSSDEARLLTAFAVISTGNIHEIRTQLSSWLPIESVKRLQHRAPEAKTTLQQLGSSLLQRNWDFPELDAQTSLIGDCQHVSEIPIFH